MAALSQPIIVEVPPAMSTKTMTMLTAWPGAAVPVKNFWRPCYGGDVLTRMTPAEDEACRRAEADATLQKSILLQGR